MQEPPRLHDRALSPPLNVIGDLHQLQAPKLPVSKKRKKHDDAGSAPQPTSAAHNPEAHPEPRRLRRLHEACARCRRKKIKCDSTLPNCGACQAAGVECTQEDRHRQTLKPRGYTDQLEAQLEKCTALLAKFIPGFRIEYLDHHLNALNVQFASPAHDHSHEYSLPPYTATPQQQQQQQQQPQHRGPGVPHLPGLVSAGGATEDLQHPTYPTETGPYSEPITQAQNTSNAITPPSARLSFDENTSPQRPPSNKSSPGLQASGPPKEKKLIKDSVDPAMLDDKGRDPHGNDMSGFAGLIRGFGVGKVYAKGVKPGLLFFTVSPFIGQVHRSVSLFSLFYSQSRPFGKT